jgi:hypothetical protein
MKKIYSFLAVCAALATASSCTKLDVPVESQYVQANFPKTTADYTALLGTMYANLSSSYGVPYWRMQELSTDEAIIPARDGNYDDGGQYRQLHYHTWTFDHPNVIGVWQWGFSGINTCNRLLTLVNSAPSPDAVKTAYASEIRAMRALYYFFMMDLYGNVPIITTFPVQGLPATEQRAKVCAFIESELKAIYPNLPRKSSVAATSTLQYGRPTREMAFALLAKLYLNNQVYTGGADRVNEVVAMADSVAKNTNYILDNKYRDIFSPNNGPQITETIFAVPYDQQIGTNQFTRFGFYPALYLAYGLSAPNLSIAMSTTPEFYNRFNIPNDFRTKTWLVGPQFVPDGAGGFTTQPAYYPGTTNQIVITAPLTLVPPKPMDLGNTVASQATGIRSIKYYPDPTITTATRQNGNDMPVLRLADVYLMKAEAILRGATPTVVNGEMQTPLILVNKLRSRAGAQTAGGIDLAGLLDERARELSWEGWRRNDLIRFGQFETEYPLPNDVLMMNKDVTRRIYPIPSTELKTNTALQQNPGYPKN